MNRVLSALIYLFLAFLIYKYVLLQLYLIDTSVWYLWIVIAILLFISFFIGGFETALNRTGDAAISGIVHSMSLQKSAVWQSLEADHFKKTGIRPAARLIYYIMKELPLVPFTTKDGNQLRQFDIEKCLVLMSTIGVIIDINVTVIFARALIKSDVFASDALAIPYVDNAVFNKILPMAGSDGFTAVGVSLLMLFLIEAVPKKLAARDPQRFFNVGMAVVLFVCFATLGVIVAVSNKVDRLASVFLRDKAPDQIDP